MDDGLRIKFLKQYYDYNKIMPTYQEMCQMFSYKSKNAAFRFVDRMIKAGFINKVGRRLAPTEEFINL
jgi:hypothetical protein